MTRSLQIEEVSDKGKQRIKNCFLLALVGCYSSVRPLCGAVWGLILIARFAWRTGGRLGYSPLALENGMNAKTLAAILMIVAAGQVARAETVTGYLNCPNGQKLIKEIECTPGETVTATATCPGSTRKIQNSMVCPSVPYPVVDWNIGAGGYFIDASVDGGAMGGGIEVVVGIYPRLGYDALRLFAQAGVGGLFTEDLEATATTEAIGLQFRFTDWFWLRAAARHRIAFLGDGDLFNGVAGEIGLTFTIARHWQIDIAGAGGKAWLPISEEVGGLDAPAGYDDGPSSFEIHKGSGAFGSGSLTFTYFFP